MRQVLFGVTLVAVSIFVTASAYWFTKMGPNPPKPGVPERRMGAREAFVPFESNFQLRPRPDSVEPLAQPLLPPLTFTSIRAKPAEPPQVVIRGFHDIARALDGGDIKDVSEFRRRSVEVLLQEDISMTWHLRTQEVVDFLVRSGQVEAVRDIGIRLIEHASATAGNAEGARCAVGLAERVWYGAKLPELALEFARLTVERFRGVVPRDRAFPVMVECYRELNQERAALRVAQQAIAETKRGSTSWLRCVGDAAAIYRRAGEPEQEAKYWKLAASEATGTQKRIYDIHLAKAELRAGRPKVARALRKAYPNSLRAKRILDAMD